MSSAKPNSRVPIPVPTLLSWSSGKDSAWALHLFREGGEYEVVALITTVDAQSGCIPIHGTRPEVLAAQAESIGLPLVTVPLGWPCCNADYESSLSQALDSRRLKIGVEHVAFGNLFLEEIRSYRTEFCRRIGWQTVFPLWGLETCKLAADMVQAGVVAAISCVGTDCLDAGCVGCLFDLDWLVRLNPSTDPCGENGEFHTLVLDSPEFRVPLRGCLGGIDQGGNLSIGRFDTEGFSPAQDGR